MSQIIAKRTSPAKRVKQSRVFPTAWSDKLVKFHQSAHSTHSCGGLNLADGALVSWLQTLGVNHSWNFTEFAVLFQEKHKVSLWRHPGMANIRWYQGPEDTPKGFQVLLFFKTANWRDTTLEEPRTGNYLYLLYLYLICIYIFNLEKINFQENKQGRRDVTWSFCPKGSGLLCLAAWDFCLIHVVWAYFIRCVYVSVCAVHTCGEYVCPFM